MIIIYCLKIQKTFSYFVLFAKLHKNITFILLKLLR